MTDKTEELQARSKLKAEFELFSSPLPTEADLFESWVEKDEVIVSIACATYNHGGLLEDAIQSFLLQETSFRFEIIIRDDASTDATRDVIAYYVQHYPRIIKAKIYKENQFKIGRRPFFDWIELTSGTYIALCEGDDFWIDRKKLQDQVEQFRQHSDIVISVAGTLHYKLHENDRAEKGLEKDERIFSGFTPQYHHTSTLLIERQAFGKVVAKSIRYGTFGDTAIRILLAGYGKCACLPRVVSVYWINSAGIWTTLSEQQRTREHVLLFARLIRAVDYRNKIFVVRSFLNFSTTYFPSALRSRDWPLIALCFIPFCLIKPLRWAKARLQKARYAVGM